MTTNYTSPDGNSYTIRQKELFLPGKLSVSRDRKRKRHKRKEILKQDLRWLPMPTRCRLLIE
jgi:hypothetical protein